jgi:hypothetical protein
MTGGFSRTLLRGVCYGNQNRHARELVEHTGILFGMVAYIVRDAPYRQ